MNRIVNERVIVQLVLLLVATALFASTFGQNFSGADLAQSPMFFPRIILIFWIGLNIIVIIQTMLSKEAAQPIASWLRIICVIVASILYTNTIESEGFFIPSMLFAGLCLIAFGIRKPVLVVLFAVAVPGVLVLLFNHMLGMPLPTSRFTYLF